MGTGTVSIIDGGGANIASLRFALDRLGAASSLTSDAGRIRESTHVILPGVGAAEAAMLRLRRSGLDEVIPDLRQPVLGICLGMQLLATASAENDTQCLGIVPGEAKGLRATVAHPVPNMGWCRTNISSAHPLLADIPDGSYFYYVHSFALPPADYTLAHAVHRDPFTAVLARENFVATQFHPERSSTAGAKLLENFLGLGG